MHYIYKENKYKLEEECEFKNPQTREWVKAVIYSSSSGQLYVREKEEFNRLFKKID